MGEWRRQNGWSWPPSTLQIISWLSIIILFPVNVLLIIPAHCIFLLAIAAIIFTWIILLMIISTTINPAIRGLKNEAVVFDKTKHLHVIEDNYCNICLIKVLVLHSILYQFFYSYSGFIPVERLHYNFLHS